MTPSRSILLLTALLAFGAADAPGDLGSVEFPTSARSPEAQRHFLRGVAALHNFWYDEAADAFRAAQAAEPGFALAYWGEALSYHHPIWREEDLDASRSALARLAPTAEERAEKAPTERERGYLAAAETLFGEGDRAVRQQRYAAALAELSARFPDDLEAASLWALALIGPALNAEAGEERDRALIRAAARLEELFDRNPDHPGVVHYMIHAYDDPLHAPLGLRAARVYARVAPAAHHALHMPSHIFVQLGRWAEVESSNRAAYDASVAWVARRGLGAEKRDFHSLQWLHYGQLQRGKVAAAKETLAIARAAAAEAPGTRVESAARWMEARQLVEAGGAAETMAAAGAAGGSSGEGAGPHAGHGGGDTGSRAAWLFARGLAAIRAGDLAAARAAGGDLDLIAAGAGTGHRDQPLRIAAKELAGAVLLAEGKSEEGFALLEEAVALEAAMPPPMGPPEPIKPAMELLAESLLAAGRAAEAATRFEASLLRTPNRAQSLLGAARTAAKEGDAERAARHYRALGEIWSEADSQPPELAAALGAARAEAAGDSPRR
jgi:tetratricopeptide (TPR) repeat protein